MIRHPSLLQAGLIHEGIPYCGFTPRVPFFVLVPVFVLVIVIDGSQGHRHGSFALSSGSRPLVLIGR